MAEQILSVHEHVMTTAGRNQQPIPTTRTHGIIFYNLKHLAPILIFDVWYILCVVESFSSRYLVFFFNFSHNMTLTLGHAM